MNPVEPKKTVLLVIDMENAFVHPDGALCIKGAASTVPACAEAVSDARDCGIPVIWVKRAYAEDYSDMEAARREYLLSIGRRGVLAPGSTGQDSIEEPDGLIRDPEEEILWKPRYSAFFATGLAEMLRKRGVDTVILSGTTTPNCIRTTCYDALSYDFRTIVLEPCTSSQTPEIQRANIIDMQNAGAEIAMRIFAKNS